MAIRGSCPMTTWPALGPQTAITAAELCTAGLRERVPCGYRALDGEAIEVCTDGCANSGRRPGPRPGTGTRSSPPCAVLRNAVHAHRTGGTRRIPRRVGAAAPAPSRARLPVPAGPGLGRREAIRPGCRACPRLARRGSLRHRARVHVRARRQQRGDDRRRRRDQEEPHPVRPVHDRRSSGRDPGQPLTRLPAGQWTDKRAAPVVRASFCVFRGRPGWRLSAGELDDRARPRGAGGRTWQRTGLSRSAG